MNFDGSFIFSSCRCTETNGLRCGMCHSDPVTLFRSSLISVFDLRRTLLPAASTQDFQFRCT
jgi:hypothetical protein